MENKLVSVIIPCHNASKTIERAIFSVLNQTYSNIELIVVDDCSSDDTVEKIKTINDRRIRLIINDQNLKAGRTRNVGLENSQGQYISFLDSDDAWAKNKIELDVCFLETHPEFGFVCSKYNSIAYYKENCICNDSLIYNEITIKSLLKRASIFTSTVTMRNCIKERFPSDIFVAEDLHYWLSIMLRKHRIANTNYVTTFYNNELSNRLSLNFKKQYISEKRACDYVYKHGAINKRERNKFKILYFLKYLRRPLKFKLIAWKEKRIAKGKKI